MIMRTSFVKIQTNSTGRNLYPPLMPLVYSIQNQSLVKFEDNGNQGVLLQNY